MKFDRKIIPNNNYKPNFITKKRLHEDEINFEELRSYRLNRVKKELEKKIDFSAGLKLNGALSIATTKGRWQELQRQATTAQLFDVDVDVLNTKQIKEKYPIINEKNI